MKEYIKYNDCWTGKVVMGTSVHLISKKVTGKSGLLSSMGNMLLLHSNGKIYVSNYELSSAERMWGYSGYNWA